MRKICLAVLVAIALCTPTTGFTAGEGIDMAKITCKEFLDAGDNMSMMLTWIDGYMSAKSDNTMLSEEWMKKLGTHMGQYCGKNPGHTIMQAMEAVPAE
ncbi:MAG: hypothetical protein IJU65_01165 [Desulfovibrio sp.]|nr:hypothetical protein [Desulfovibrio sp.]